MSWMGFWITSIKNGLKLKDEAMNNHYVFTNYIKAGCESGSQLPTYIHRRDGQITNEKINTSFAVTLLIS